MAIHPDPAFLALVDAHEETLLRAARLLTGDWEQAEELLRGTLAWALSTWSSLSSQSAAPLRLRQRLVAAYLDQFAAAEAVDEEAADDEAVADEAVADEAADDEAGDESALEVHVPPLPRPASQGRTLLDSLEQLTAEDRAILVARYYLGLSAAEIGEVLGTDAGDVATIEAQALATLRWVR